MGAGRRRFTACKLQRSLCRIRYVSWTWKQGVPPKRWKPFTKVYYAMNYKTTVFVTIEGIKMW